MDNNFEKYIPFIAKLNQLTQQSKIIWECTGATVSPFNFGASSNSAMKNYTAEYKGKILKVFMTNQGLNGISTLDYKPALSIENANGVVDWTIKNVSGLSDLYHSISMRETGVDQYIDEILNED